MKKKQYLVIGLGRFGSAVAIELQRQGMEVLAVDRDMERVEQHRRLLTEVVRADAMDRAALEQLGAPAFETAVVTIGGDVTASCTVTMLLKELGVKQVIVKTYDDFHSRMLVKLGADKVVFPERDMGQRIAHNIVSEKILDFIELSPEYSMTEMRPQPSWVGRTLGELDLRASDRINVVALRSKEGVNAMPNARTRIREGDVLLVVSQAQRR